MTTTPDLDLSAAARALRAPRVVCMAHMDPDADTLGSALALTHALRAVGTDAVTAVGSPAGAADVVPGRLQALPGAGDLVTTEVESHPDVVAVLDCAVAERLGGLAGVLDRAGRVVWLDHHQPGEPQGSVVVVDPAAAATAEIVARLVGELGVALTGDVATCCYAGLVTDTGRFTNEATTPSALRLAAELIEGGVDVVGLNRALFDVMGFEQLRLLGRVLAGAHREPGGLVWSTVTEHQLAEAGLTLADTDGVVELLRDVEDARCALLLKQRATGGLKGSLRGVGEVEVASIAGRFGGGGHRRAAGFDTQATVADVVAGVVEALDGRRERG